MIINTKLLERGDSCCELCTSKSDELIAYLVPPKKVELMENQVLMCMNCYNKIVKNDISEPDYWMFLSGSIWSEVDAVKVVSYKILQQVKTQDWAIEILDSVFLEDNILEWASAENDLLSAEVIHKDSYGVVLQSGDNVILTQNLNVKGANFIAPKGTLVKKIRLVADNEEQIEGKIEGDTIVILTKYVRKSS